MTDLWRVRIKGRVFDEKRGGGEKGFEKGFK